MTARFVFVPLGPQGMFSSVSPLKEHEDPISKGFIEACSEIGMPKNPDNNAGKTEGVSSQQFNHHRGLRVSAATGYLRPARKRSNLKICTGAQVDRLLLSSNRVSGVVATIDGTQQTFTARHETILSAGVLHTPHLLELSGIGNGRLLAEQGIDVVKHLPGVGENSSDHLQTRTSFEATWPVTVNDTSIQAPASATVKRSIF